MSDVGLPAGVGQHFQDVALLQVAAVVCAAGVVRHFPGALALPDALPFRLDYGRVVTVLDHHGFRLSSPYLTTMTLVTPDSDAASTAAEQVASILEAAEQAAERLRVEAQERVRNRIAEGDRAAELRVSAAEEEAAEILTAARNESSSSIASAREEASRTLAKVREEAAGLRDQAAQEAKRMRSEAEQEAKRIVSEAGTRGLEAVGHAESEAERLRAESAKDHEEAAWKAQDLMRAAEQTAAEIDIEGNQVVRDLRELGDSLRANAERLLRDVQAIHSRMVEQIERIESAAREAPSRGRSRGDTDSAAAEGPTRPRRRTTAAPSADGDELDVPEFLPPG